MSQFSDKRPVAITTFALALIGAVTGVTGTVLGLLSRSDETRFALTVRATTEAFDVGSEGPTLIRVGLANSGLRGVIVRDATVTYRGVPFGQTLGFVAAGSEPGEVLPLPLTLGGREGRTIRIVVEPPSSVVEHGREVSLSKSALVTGGEHLGRLEAIPGLRLDLDVQPRGVRAYPVLNSSSPSGSTRVRVSGGRFRANRLVELTLRGRYEFAVHRPAIAELEIWPGSGSGRSITVSRPLNDSTTFPLPRLRAGSYEFALRSGDTVIDTGKLAVSCSDGCTVHEPSGSSW